MAFSWELSGEISKIIFLIARHPAGEFRHAVLITGSGGCGKKKRIWRISNDGGSTSWAAGLTDLCIVQLLAPFSSAPICDRVSRRVFMRNQMFRRERLMAVSLCFVRCAAQQSDIHRRPGSDAAAERVGSPLQQVRGARAAASRPAGGFKHFRAALPFAKVTCELVWTVARRYGGGPAVNHLYVCHTCQIEIEKLEKRRKQELDMFVRVRTPPPSPPIYPPERHQSNSFL